MANAPLAAARRRNACGCRRDHPLLASIDFSLLNVKLILPSLILGSFGISCYHQHSYILTNLPVCLRITSHDDQTPVSKSLPSAGSLPTHLSFNLSLPDLTPLASLGEKMNVLSAPKLTDAITSLSGVSECFLCHQNRTSLAHPIYTSPASYRFNIQTGTWPTRFSTFRRSSSSAGGMGELIVL